jgi:hypothetical protein
MKRLLLVPVLVLLAACAGDGASSGTSRARGGDGPPPTLRTFPAETQTFMQTGLRQFSAQDPQWEQTRRQWLAMGPRETEFLVQLLWAALVAGQAGNNPEMVERSRAELALVGDPSIPFLLEVLSAENAGTVVDPKTGERVPIAIDDAQRREAGEVLALIGPPALPAVLDALGRAGTKSGRRFALQALGNMGDRGGPDAAAALAQHARDPDLVLAVEAVFAMRNLHDGTTRAALLGALQSPEQLVREKAADSLAGRLDKSVLPDLQAAAGRARAEGRMAEAQRMERAARALARAGDERR